MTRRMSGCPKYFERTEGRDKFLSAGEQSVRSEVVEVFADSREVLIHFYFEPLRNAGLAVGFIQPRNAPVTSGHQLEVRGFGVVHGELGAGEFQQPRGLSPVVGMHVREQNLADLAPLNTALLHRGA